MRIALLSESTALGGGERVVAHLIEYYQGVGHEVHLVVPNKVRDGWLDRFARDSGAQCHYVPLEISTLPGAVLGIQKILRTHRIQYVHAHMFGMICVGAVAARLAGADIVATLHNGNEDWSLLKRRIPLAVALRLTNHNTVVSSEMLHSSARATWLPKESFRVVYNGANMDVNSGASLREELGIATHEKVILCLGSRTVNKNHVAVIRAVSMLDFPVRIIIAGRDGDGSHEIDRAIEETGVTVHCLGHRSDIADLLHAADIMALPSKREGLPMAIVEAMLSGTPIVASAVGGIPEVLEHGRSALLFSPDDIAELRDHLRLILLNPPKAASLASSARQYANSYLTVEAMGKAYLQLLQRSGKRGNDA